MAKKIYDEIKNRIQKCPEGDIFFTSDFNDIASLPTIRKCLGRQVEEGSIRRIIDGVYDKPRYSELLEDYVPADPEKVAYALAKKYHWTIAPCGDVALNKLGLSAQVPAVWSFVSDGPYRDFQLGNARISFRHKTNREISLMSDISVMLIEAFRALGKERIDENTIALLQKRLTREEKDIIMRETTESASWIFDNVRKVCG